MLIHSSADTSADSSDAESARRIDLSIPLELESKIRSASQTSGSSVEEIVQKAILQGLIALENSQLSAES